MKTIEIQGSTREGVGKSATKKVRSAGMVPGTVYGQGEPQNVAIGYNDIKKALYTPETFIVNLSVDGTATQSIIQEAQYHPVTDRILHVDFLRVSDAEPVEVRLPIRLVGTAQGVLAGGRMVPLMRRIKVRGIPSNLPEAVEINIEHLELGQTITVGQTNIEGLEITSPSSAGIAVVDIPRAVRQAQNAEGGEEGEAAAEE